MKKDKEWLKDSFFKLDKNPSWGTTDYHFGYSDAFEMFEGLIDQLDEPEIAEEPTFLEHLTRLFKKHGYDHLGQVALALENDLEISINKELPVIPQFVADWIEKCKDGDYNLFGVFDYAEGEVKDWIFNEGIKNKKINLVARAWLDGYTIEPPKTLQVIVKNYDDTVFTTELPEDEAMKLIEGWKEDDE